MLYELQDGSFENNSETSGQSKHDILDESCFQSHVQMNSSRITPAYQVQSVIWFCLFC
jgi:hypothetical protein